MTLIGGWLKMQCLEEIDAVSQSLENGHMRTDTPSNPTLARLGPTTLAGGLFLAGLVLAALALFVPFSPNMPAEGLDPSWMYAMNQALAQGLVIGKDVVFTFGPYASIYTRVYHPATDHLMVWGSVFLALSFALAAFLNFRNSKWSIQLALLVVLSTVMYSPDVLLFFYTLLVGTYLYRVIAEKALSGSGKESLILVALFAPFGLIPLIKGSALIACVAIAIFSAYLLWNAGRRSLAVLACATPPVLMAAFWLVAKQPLLALPQYFMSMLPIISGYTEAMAVNGNPAQLLAFVVGTAILAHIVFQGQAVALRLKAVVILMFLCMLFLAFKAGFVRHDAHAVISSSMLLLTALLASTLVSPARGRSLLLCAVAVWAAIDAAYVNTSTEAFFKNLNATYAKAWDGARMRVSHPAQLKADFDSRLAALKSLAGFPTLPGSVDIYSYEQSLLIGSGNHWNPRPVLQSYSVYTPALAERNKNHLLSEGRPDNILFKVQPIDDRLPALEEGLSWPVLLSNYAPQSFANGFLLLQHRAPGDIAPVESKEYFKRTYALGERVELAPTGKVLYAKVVLKKSLLGRISNTLLKPSQLDIKLTRTDGAVKKYRMIASMAETGFVVSPLIESTEDFGLLFSGTDFLRNKQVASFTIDAAAPRSLWRDTYEVELTSVAYKESGNVASLYGFAQPVDEAALGKALAADHCDGSIDAINGVSPAPAQAKLPAILEVNGWLAPLASKATLPDKTYLVLSNEQGKRYFIETRPNERPDVAEFFKQPPMKAAGFAIKADVSKLEGDALMGLAYAKGGTLFLCPQFKVKTSFMRR